MNIVGLYGGSGFIGSHFQSMLSKISNDTEVFLLPHRKSNNEIKSALRKLDAINSKNVHKSILYLGENNDIAKANKSGFEYIKKNTERLKFILSNSKCRIIYASSVAVYGDSSELIHHPEDKVEATNTYTNSKLECEKLVLQADGIVARLSNIYGIGMSKKNIISDVLKQINSKGVNSINIINGSPKRDLIHISDVTACLLAMTKIQEKGVYNVATGINISMKDLTLMILESSNLLDCKIEESKHSKQTSCISVDITKTKETFNWSPYITLKDGLKELV